MARCIIVIDDKADGNVSIQASPKFEEIIAMDRSGNSLTAAHTYALRMLNAATEFSNKAKRGKESSIIKVPRIKYAH